MKCIYLTEILIKILQKQKQLLFILFLFMPCVDLFVSFYLHNTPLQSVVIIIVIKNDGRINGIRQTIARLCKGWLVKPSKTI